MKRLFTLVIGIGIGIAGYHYYPQAVRYYHSSTPSSVRHTQADDAALLRDVIKCLEAAETPAERRTREIREWKAEEQRRFDALQSAVKRAEAIDVDAIQSECEKLGKQF